jgi:hypothetical protein
MKLHSTACVVSEGGCILLYDGSSMSFGGSGIIVPAFLLLLQKLSRRNPACDLAIHQETDMLISL